MGMTGVEGKMAKSRNYKEYGLRRAAKGFAKRKLAAAIVVFTGGGVLSGAEQ